MEEEGSIIFSVVGRTHYGFDIFSVPLPASVQTPFDPSESLLTDGFSVNYNGSFATDEDERAGAGAGGDETLIFVSERSGAPKLYIKECKESHTAAAASMEGPLFQEEEEEEVEGSKEAEEEAAEGSKEAAEAEEERISHLFFDRPFLNRKENLVYFIATQKAHPGSLRQSWTGVYCRGLGPRGEGFPIRKPTTPPRGEGFPIRKPTTPPRSEGFPIRKPTTPPRSEGFPTRKPTTPRGEGFPIRKPPTPRGEGFPIRKLTPRGVADLSPSLSPCGKWVAVASYQERKGGWKGEVQDLNTDIYVFRSRDGGGRQQVVSGGAWPTWASHGRALFFHRKSADGWWSIYKVELPHLSYYELEVENGEKNPRVTPPLDHVSVVERVTPPLVHAFTPAASLSGEWLAVATRRPPSPYRHIEIFDLSTGAFVPVTAPLHPDKHHYNPFVSVSSRTLGYHRCRDIHPVVGPETFRDENEHLHHGHKALSPARVHRLEAIESPTRGLSLVRIDGFFPSVSPCGRFIAYNKSLPSPSSRDDTSSLGLYVMRSDGSKAWKLADDGLFYTSWDPVREGVIYCIAGPIFAPASANVHVAALHFSLDLFTDEAESVPSRTRILTEPGTGNNAFPAPSPDGKWLVFRSGRDGGVSGKGKNLYVMDAERGEAAEIRRLTCGDWVDTMPNWSPNGEWIVFSSTMDSSHGGEGFGLYMIRPDGTGLHRVTFEKSTGTVEVVHGRVNHAEFSPDSRHLVFTSDMAALSAEPISLPNQFQPYGEIFVSRVDGSGLVRLTHNAYEDGTPTWTSTKIKLHHYSLPYGGPPFVASVGSEPLRGDFSEPLWLEASGER